MFKVCSGCGAIFYEPKSSECVICAKGIILEKIEDDRVLKIIEKGNGRSHPIWTWNIPAVESCMTQ